MKKIIMSLVCLFVFSLTGTTYAIDWELTAVHWWERIVGNIQLEYTTGNVFRYKEGFVDRMFIQLRNARDPQWEDRAFYNAWVENKNTGEFIDLGPLSQTRHNFYQGELRRGTDDITGFNYFVISLEANDGNPAKGTHVYEGEIFDTTIEYVDDFIAAQQLAKQPIIDIVQKRLWKISDKTRKIIRENLFSLRQKTITSTQSNDYKLQVLFLLDAVEDAIKL